MNQKKQQWQSKHRICLFSRYEIVWDNKPLKMVCNILSVWVQERPIYFFIYTHLVLFLTVEVYKLAIYSCYLL